MAGRLSLPRTRRAYALDLTAWQGWLHGLDVDVLDARRVHVDLWVRQLVDHGAAASSTGRRLSAVTSFYGHLGEHDLSQRIPPLQFAAPPSTPATPRPSVSTATRPAS